jgi:formate--tetrahydrofolate ligase
VAAVGAPRRFAHTYALGDPIEAKQDAIVRRVYGGDGVELLPAARAKAERWRGTPLGHLPVCMAKTQYSFTTDPNVRGAPTGHSIPVREVRLSAGAGFIVAICGEIMTMPGLPRVPSAEVIKLNDKGEVEGLF